MWRSCVDKLVLTVKRIGAVCLTGMMVVTVIDVATRGMGKPVFGLVEIVSLLAVIVLASAMPATHVENGHVGVGLLLHRLKPRTQALIDGITGILGTLLFAVVTWQMFIYAGMMRRSGEVSMSLQLPTYLLIYAVAVAFGVLALVILVAAIDNFRKAAGS